MADFSTSTVRAHDAAPKPQSETTSAAQNYLRIVCISDTHNKHLAIADIPDGDVLIHAGDFSSTGKLAELEEFRAFIDSQPHRHKIIIAGNHDITLQTEYYDAHGAKRFHSMLSRRGDFCAYEYSQKCRDVIAAPNKPDAVALYTYLEDSSCVLLVPTRASGEGIKVHGSPWQPEFFNWAYNLPRGAQLKEKWDLIPDDTDVLITHGPPHNILDECSNHYHAGCTDLLETIQSRVRPRLHVFGHIHETYGVHFDGTTLYVNASTCNLHYRPLNEPIVVHLPFDSTLPAYVVAPESFCTAK